MVVTVHMDLIRRIRALLDRLASSRRLDSDAQEEIGDEVATEARSLPREGIVGALDKAVGRNKRRREESVYLLCEWTDVPEVVNRMCAWVDDPDPKWRSWIVQTAGSRQLVQLAPAIRGIIERDPDEFCRDVAIHAAAKLKSSACLPAVLRLAGAGDPKLTWRLATALKEYATEECRPHLQRWFNDVSLGKSTRIFAAWGLGRLGDDAALDHLVAMLDDPDECGEKFFHPGESLRAAQALCDLHDWPFEWNSSQVAKTKLWISQRRAVD